MFENTRGMKQNRRCCELVPEDEIYIWTKRLRCTNRKHCFLFETMGLGFSHLSSFVNPPVSSNSNS